VIPPVAPTARAYQAGSFCSRFLSLMSGSGISMRAPPAVKFTRHENRLALGMEENTLSLVLKKA
jgi:hypothetical protein